jgi:4-hydroxyphenylpyruvate dioxygenase
VKTGLTSYALRSPCGKFCIPINEADEKKSQINEYLEEYKGPGIQHLAFATGDILGSLDKLEGSDIEFLDIEDDYYARSSTGCPTSPKTTPASRTTTCSSTATSAATSCRSSRKNLVGPIFIEIIQRKNHLGFGEGNFGALFRSIERDQGNVGDVPTFPPRPRADPTQPPQFRVGWNPSR